jgi:hypothetical protein
VGNTPCGFKFNDVSLPVIEGKAVAFEIPLSGDGETGGRIESSAQETNGPSAFQVLHS